MPSPIRPPHEARSLLAGTRLFGGLDERALDEVVQRVEWLHIAGGETLFRLGDPGDALYLVASGRLQAILEEEPGAVRVLREVGRGENVGEMSLIISEPRSATVRAVRDTEVARLSRADFAQVLEAHPSARLRLIESLTEWLHRMTHPRPSSSIPKTIAVIPVDGGAPAAEIAAALVSGLLTAGSTMHLTASTVDHALGKGCSDAERGSSEYARTTTWLDALEGNHSFVVYEAPLAVGSWSRRCVRQADRIFLVAGADSDPDEMQPATEDLFREVAASSARIELLLARRDASGAAPGASRWLARQPLAAHHHVDLDAPGDVARLVRQVTGRAVGLVLSGGGARGFAHVGVIRALEEAGIPIDRIGGTSMGAVIGAQYSCGYDVEQMLELNRMWAADNPLWDLTLPVVSLVSGRAGTRILAKMFGDRCIEDLRREYFCVTTNLTRSRVEVHRAGPLVRWVAASISIPGIAPPTRSDSGDLLVDGGVLNNLPVDVMRLRNEGPIVAVDVAPVEELSLRSGEADETSPWWLFVDRFNPFGSGRQVPGIYKILERSTLVASLAHSEEMQRSVDLYVAPPVASFGVFDWKQVDRLAELGFEFARRRIEVWQESGGSGV